MQRGAAAVVLPADLDGAGPLLPSGAGGPRAPEGATAEPDPTSPALALRIVTVPAADRD